MNIKFHINTIFHSLYHFYALNNDIRVQLIKAGFTDEDIIKQMDSYGSKFDKTFAQSPQEVVAKLLSHFPKKFENLKSESDGRVRLSFKFDSPIGYTNILDRTQLTPAEYATLHKIERNGVIVNVAESTRRFPTCECQLILTAIDSGYDFCSTFPGELAPPLTQRHGGLNPYWDKHIFIKSI